MKFSSSVRMFYISSRYSRYPNTRQFPVSPQFFLVAFANIRFRSAIFAKQTAMQARIEKFPVKIPSPMARGIFRKQWAHHCIIKQNKTNKELSFAFALFRSSHLIVLSAAFSFQYMVQCFFCYALCFWLCYLSNRNNRIGVKVHCDWKSDQVVAYLKCRVFIKLNSFKSSVWAFRDNSFYVLIILIIIMWYGYTYSVTLSIIIFVSKSAVYVLFFLLRLNSTCRFKFYHSCE